MREKGEGEKEEGETETEEIKEEATGEEEVDEPLLLFQQQPGQLQRDRRGEGVWGPRPALGPRKGGGPRCQTSSLHNAAEQW